MAYQAKRKSKQAGQPRTYRGKRVEDATTNFRFNVLMDDCRRGKADDPQACAGARAIKRSYPAEVLAVHVHRQVTMVELKNKVIRFRTPHGLRDQLLRFDAGKKFDPGNYHIGTVCPSTVKARGRAHSPPDRVHGAANSAAARSKTITLKHDVGRGAFHFTSENSDFK
jgi:hypothetical protein